MAIHSIILILYICHSCIICYHSEFNGYQDSQTVDICKDGDSAASESSVKCFPVSKCLDFQVQMYNAIHRLKQSFKIPCFSNCYWRNGLYGYGYIFFLRKMKLQQTVDKQLKSCKIHNFVKSAIPLSGKFCKLTPFIRRRTSRSEHVDGVKYAV